MKNISKVDIFEGKDLRHTYTLTFLVLLSLLLKLRNPTYFVEEQTFLLFSQLASFLHKWPASASLCANTAPIFAILSTTDKKMYCIDLLHNCTQILLWSLWVGVLYRVHPNFLYRYHRQCCWTEVIFFRIWIRIRLFRLFRILHEFFLICKT